MKSALKKSIFKVTLSTEKYPFVFLGLDIKTEYLDVNIHPAKKHISMKDSDKIILWLIFIFEQFNKNRQLDCKFVIDKKDKCSSILKCPSQIKKNIMFKNMTDQKKTTIDSYILKKSMIFEKNSAKKSRTTDDYSKAQINPIFLSQLGKIKLAVNNRSACELISSCILVGLKDNQTAFLQCDLSLYLMELEIFISHYFMNQLLVQLSSSSLRGKDINKDLNELISQGISTIISNYQIAYCRHTTKLDMGNIQWTEKQTENIFQHFWCKIEFYVRLLALKFK